MGIESICRRNIGHHHAGIYHRNYGQSTGRDFSDKIFSHSGRGNRCEYAGSINEHGFSGRHLPVCPQQEYSMANRKFRCNFVSALNASQNRVPRRSGRAGIYHAVTVVVYKASREKACIGGAAARDFSAGLNRLRVADKREWTGKVGRRAANRRRVRKRKH